MGAWQTRRHTSQLQPTELARDEGRRGEEGEPGDGARWWCVAKGARARKSAPPHILALARLRPEPPFESGR